MAEIDVRTEQEDQQQWSYQVGVKTEDASRTFQVTLGFSDYDLWSRGKVSPSRVVEEAFRFLLEREPLSAILPRFDCSVIRRYFPEADEELPKRL